MDGLRFAILGAARSGLAAIRALVRRGARPWLVDQKGFDDLNEPVRYAIREEGLVLAHELDFSKTDVVVTSPGVAKDHPWLTEARAKGLEVWSEIELAYRLSSAPIVAVTGTNGKSTTTLMTYLVLRGSEFEPILCGNIYGSGYEEVPLTEAAADSTPGQVLVAETSSFQLEWVQSFRPRAATITNIEQDHLNRYSGFDEYAATKHRIFAAMGEGDTAVWRSGDGRTKPPSGLRTATYGTLGDDAYVQDGKLWLGQSSVNLSELPFNEAHNLLNAQAAALLARGAVGHTMSDADLLEGLKAFDGLEHRMERQGERDGVLVINNSMCTNPAAIEASSKSLPMRQHLLIGGVNKDMDFSPLAPYLAASGHAVYLFGTDGAAIGRQIGGDWPVFTTLAEAFTAAAKAAKAGEAIMLAPGAASTDQFKDFRDRGEQFRAMAKEWLES
jgi:UDP-N-acetylmuramoylalanine--D-glutamate ligase